MNKPKAKRELTYCTNKNCQKECWRKEENWEFEEDGMYSFMDKCEEEVI